MDLQFKGIAKEVFLKIKKLQKENLALEDYQERLQNLIKEEMPKIEISEKDNQGESVLIGIDVDAKLRVYSMTGSRAPRFSTSAVKILFNFIRENYEVD
jgi:hypothetical protein